MTMRTKPVVPAHEGLRRAIAWLAEQDAWSPRIIEEACQRFDIAPVYRHRSAGLLPQVRRAAGMVIMSVRNDYKGDILRPDTVTVHRFQYPAAVAGYARVNDNRTLTTYNIGVYVR